ncbi:hypothetical protein G5I_02779 [Acromyrmex echinatior]|uniref:Uncharacterized protein n=1 Tax=Acromyrmex echinatior TaxID=103372 RepID=F4WB75_ACREC|nr:hypothetical protein G5I_02779 [Acromyrmex echinatior]
MRTYEAANNLVTNSDLIKGEVENFVSLLSFQAAPPPGYLFRLLGSLRSELLLLRGKGQLTSNKKKKTYLLWPKYVSKMRVREKDYMELSSSMHMVQRCTVVNIGSTSFSPYEKRVYLTAILRTMPLAEYTGLNDDLYSRSEAYSSHARCNVALSMPTNAASIVVLMTSYWNAKTYL